MTKGETPTVLQERRWRVPPGMETCGSCAFRPSGRCHLKCLTPVEDRSWGPCPNDPCPKELDTEHQDGQNLLLSPPTKSNLWMSVCIPPLALAASRLCF